MRAEDSSNRRGGTDTTSSNNIAQQHLPNRGRVPGTGRNLAVVDEEANKENTSVFSNENGVDGHAKVGKTLHTSSKKKLEQSRLLGPLAPNHEVLSESNILMSDHEQTQDISLSKVPSQFSIKSRPLESLKLPVSTSSSASSNVVSPQQPYKYLLALLESCTPPMGNILDRFVKVECDKEEFVVAVSTWRPEAIRSFLERLPPSASGQRLSTMEVYILQNHWLQYFS
ncbi:hypothetical protein CPB83DRAFT_911076 [Crepidotus variabilis]|uniref:Uncharacterized protein n=1 Tax=Crepidotus variabilis TaxID=179855 RepID=A0A9P6E5J4_9AGAR|nr:hypothetical protein CPB83DRAFT_911076 [Crepidotus variabilis]